jgi:hypothetical protein
LKIADTRSIPDKIYGLVAREARLARSPKISPALKERAAQIKVLLMDVDGTMTDGGVTLLSQPDGSALACEQGVSPDVRVRHCCGAPTK